MLRLLSVAFGLFLLALPASIALAQDSAPMDVRVVSLKAAGGSTANGWAWVIPQPGQMIVTTLVTGLEPGSSHSNHIHRGSCETPGDIAYNLTDLTANADGVATATTLVKANMVPMGTNYVNIHAGMLPSGPASITCGNIDDSMMMPMPPGGM